MEEGDRIWNQKLGYGTIDRVNGKSLDIRFDASDGVIPGIPVDCVEKIDSKANNYDDPSLW